MRPNIVVDIGNSRVKWGRCVDGRVAEMVSLAHGDYMGWGAKCSEWRYSASQKWAVAGVHPEEVQNFRKWAESCGDEVLVLEHANIPLRNSVDLPKKAGMDRLLNALAATKWVQPGQPAVIVDVGTATTVDYLDDNMTFRGGAILPGPDLMAKSLHEYTAKLPLLYSIRPPQSAWGSNTVEAMSVGILAATCGAVERLTREYGMHARHSRQKPLVLITGGGHEKLKGCHFDEQDAMVHVVDTLTLDGILLAAEALS